jgi:alpha-methylacyl-CoA racemase
MGILAALVERGRSGRGQVVDAAMIDGSAQLMSIFWGLDSMGAWGPRGTNLLDGGAHFYNVYETADGGYVSLAAYEPKFYANFLRLVAPLGFDDLEPAGQMDMAQWPALKVRLAELFRTKTRDEWITFFAGTEVCFAPVLPMSEARTHPHNVEREMFIDVGGSSHPAPAPRFSRSTTSVQGAPVKPGTDTDTALADWGFDAGDIAQLKNDGAVA